MTAADASPDLAAADAAIVRGDWTAARDLLHQALAREETALAHERLGLVERILVNDEGAFHHQARAFELYRAAGDDRGAGRMAIFIGGDAFDYRGEVAVANGWIARGIRLLAPFGTIPELGVVAWYDGIIPLMTRNDTVAAIEAGRRAARIGREVGSTSIEMLGLALEGLALVSAGRVTEGMTCIDEAAAAAIHGEVPEPDFRGAICCALMDACGRVRDFDRAREWAPRIEHLCGSLNLKGFFSLCRPNYALALMWRGDWLRAEQELLYAAEELGSLRAAFANEAIVRLAELRVRQGRFDEARSLLDAAGAEPLAQLPMAILALAEGRLDDALDQLERYRRRMPADARAEHAAGLDVLVQVRLARGELDAAEAACDELQAIAGGVGTAAFVSTALVARGLVAAAREEWDAARAALEDARDRFDRGGGVVEAARARLELARVCSAGARRHAAIENARAALAVFRQVGAAFYARQAEDVLAALGAPAAATAGSGVSDLSSREREVLALVARGYSNHEIAETLVLSVRTVERHISNIYEKLEFDGPGARAAATAYAVTHGLL